MPGGPPYSGLRGPMVFKWAPFALDQGPQLAQVGPAGDRVLIGGPRHYESWLQEASQYA